MIRIAALLLCATAASADGYRQADSLATGDYGFVPFPDLAFCWADVSVGRSNRIHVYADAIVGPGHRPGLTELIATDEGFIVWFSDQRSHLVFLTGIVTRPCEDGETLLVSMLNGETY